MHETARLMGLTDASGGWYLFWSGIFGDAGLLAGSLVLLRKHNCHERGCWRLARHPNTETGAITCHKHR